MPFRPLKEEEKADVLRCLEEARADRQKIDSYIAELKKELYEGRWYSSKDI